MDKLESELTSTLNHFYKEKRFKFLRIVRDKLNRLDLVDPKEPTVSKETLERIGKQVKRY